MESWPWCWTCSLSITLQWNNTIWGDWIQLLVGKVFFSLLWYWLPKRLIHRCQFHVLSNICSLNKTLNNWALRKWLMATPLSSFLQSSQASLLDYLSSFESTTNVQKHFLPETLTCHTGQGVTLQSPLPFPCPFLVLADFLLADSSLFAGVPPSTPVSLPGDISSWWGFP